ncbi:unnamed protein product [Parascedosporium putredinis]|uniref:Uncharacterized protein n=1 Tax=Parascedosporium putredinis TaxID=1442378 RepID=A0A9P1GYW2_9PEZI|nr:unnamed protein product [Parascedosporium putredinis]CAI7992219.1 unnamed protein product [Parascedosporium putredinis]
MSFWSRWFRIGTNEDVALARLLPSVPKPVGYLKTRQIVRFFPEVMRDPDFQDAAIDDPDNTYCLLELFLGRDAANNPKVRRVGNRPLGLKEIHGEIGVEGSVRLAETMGLTLAVLHWGLLLDGHDIRFAIGARLFPTHRAVYLTRLSKMRKIRPGIQDIRSCLVPAFNANRSFPRPSLTGFAGKMWRVFRKVYLDVSLYIIHHDKKQQLIFERRTRWVLPIAFIRHLDFTIYPQPKGSDPGVAMPSGPYLPGPYDAWRERKDTLMDKAVKETDAQADEAPAPEEVVPRRWGARWRCGANGQGDAPDDMDFILPKPSLGPAPPSPGKVDKGKGKEVVKNDQPQGLDDSCMGNAVLSAILDGPKIGPLGEDGRLAFVDI